MLTSLVIRDGYSRPDMGKGCPFPRSGVASALVFENSIHSDAALSRERLGESFLQRMTVRTSPRERERQAQRLLEELSSWLRGAGTRNWGSGSCLPLM